MPYTTEEESWFSSRLVKYDKAYEDVQFGHDWITEFVMFSYDVPLSKHFATNGYATFLERFKRILMAHDGFQDLSTKDQVFTMILLLPIVATMSIALSGIIPDYITKRIIEVRKRSL